MKHSANTSGYYGWIALTLVTVGATTGCCPHATSPAPREVARASLQRMADVYATASSYRDKAVVVSITAFDSTTEMQVSAMTFETAFRRPSGLRFELHEEGPPASLAMAAAVWGDPKNGHYWASFDAQRRDGRPVASMLRNLLGVSNGASGIVPLMLLGEKAWTRFDAASVVGREEATGAWCSRIALSATNEVWVDERSFLVRKIWSRTVIDPKAVAARLPADERARKDIVLSGRSSTVEQTIYYRPEIGVSVRTDEIEFVPPPPTPD